MALINAINGSVSYDVSVSRKNSILSDDTINKLKDLDIDISKVSSESEAKRLIDKAEEENSQTGSVQTEAEDLYNDIKNLGRKLGLEFVQSENIQDVFDKISTKLDEFSEGPINSNVDILRSELDVLKREFKFLYSGDSSMLSAMDILAQNKRAVLGI